MIIIICRVCISPYLLFYSIEENEKGKEKEEVTIRNKAKYNPNLS